MATFVMFGKYSAEALKEMSAERTEKGVSLIKKFGCESVSLIKSTLKHLEIKRIWMKHITYIV